MCSALNSKWKGSVTLPQLVSTLSMACMCANHVATMLCGFIVVVKKLLSIIQLQKKLDVYYEGNHICTPKPDVLTKCNFFERLPIRRNLRLAPQEVRNDAMQYYFLTKQWEKGLEVALHMNDPALIEKLRYILPGHKKFNFPDDEAILFSNIADIKKQADKWDKFLIYKINCEKTNGGTSYVFKISEHHLEMVVKMDATQRTVRGKVSMAYL